MLRGGDGPREVEGLKPYGITHAGQRHHSDKAEVVYRHSKVVL
jgi:hypothetical protein